MLVYPALPALLDLGVARVAGAGLGNCFYTYFHAFRLARASGRRLVAPTWPALRIGPWLRGERTKRDYASALQPHPDELAGAPRLAALLTPSGRATVLATGAAGTALPQARLTTIAVERFSFDGLHPIRAEIRERLLAILRRPLGAEPDWGRAPYAAAHVRLGDFAPGSGEELRAGERANLRLPLDWYVGVLGAIRARHPSLPIRIFSDGHPHELAPLLAIAGTSLAREADDVRDLVGLAGARLLVGSASTFSRWAAFLGDMPSVWLDTARRPEQPTAPSTPIGYVPLGGGVVPDLPV